MPQIDKGLAKKIAKKLRAKVDRKSGSAHDIATVFYDGKLIKSFGIRRGSKKNLGHDHIPDDLGVRMSFAKELGRCTKSLEQYLVEIGEIDEDEDEDEDLVEEKTQ